MRRRSTFNKIICAILAGLLIVELVAVFGISLLKKTVLSKEYIKRELEKVNYYQVTKAEVEDAFKYYVLQSNLDDSCVENLVTAEKVKKDTLLLLEQAYNGKKEEIDIESIKDELNNRIHSKVVNEYNNVVTQSEENDIEELVDVIVENYSNSMDTIKTCFSVVQSINKKLDIITEERVKTSYAIMAGTIALLSIVYIVGSKNKKIVLNKYHAIAFMTVGAMMLITMGVLSIVVKEGQIQLFTKGITLFVIDIIKNIKSTILIFGTLSFMTGFLISLVKNILLRKYLK